MLTEPTLSAQPVEELVSSGEMRFPEVEWDVPLEVPQLDEQCAEQEALLMDSRRAFDVRACSLDFTEAEPEERGVVTGRIETGPLPIDERDLVLVPEHVAGGDVTVREPELPVSSPRQVQED